MENSENNYANLLLEILESYNLSQVVPLTPTHIDGGTIDLIMVADDFRSKISGVNIDSQITYYDHYLISCFINLDCEIKNTSYKILTYRNFKSIAIDDFKNDLCASNLNNLERSTTASLSDICADYKDTLRNLVDVHCPIIKRKLFNKHEAWFDSELRDLRRRRRKAERDFRKVSNLANKASYNRLKKHMKFTIKNKRKQFNKSSIESEKGNTKQLYKKLNKLLGQGESILPDSCNDELLAENFKNFFTSKIKNIRENIISQSSGIPNNTSVEFSPPCELVKFNTITVDQLKDIVFSLPNKNSPLDEVPIWLLKECFEELSPTILTFVNKSIETGIFPDALKHAYVIPVIKDREGDHDSLKNYRPISNLSTLSKILEKTIQIQLNKYLVENSLYCEVQSGYRAGHSCETLLIKLTDDVIADADKNNIVAMLLLDLSAAFDAIDHSMLLNKLKDVYGLKDSALKWFQTYLSNRSFSVRINESNSSIEIILYGVPQGSILGPILFVLYTKELSAIALKYNINLRLYADDSTVYVKLDPKNMDEIHAVITKTELCLSEMGIWMNQNYLKLNEDKTQLVLLGKPLILNKVSSDTITINFNGNLIENVILGSKGTSDLGKALGIKLNNDISMKRQILSVKQSCFSVLRNLRNIKEFLDEDTKLMLVKSLILSKVDFCNALYTNIPHYQINELGKIINASLRFIYNLKFRDHISTYYVKAHILPIKYRIQYKCCLMVHKCIHNVAPIYLKNMISYHASSTPNYSLRSTTDCFSLSCTKTARTSCFAERRFTIYAPTIWNELSIDLRSCTDTDAFKKLLKTHFFDCYTNNLNNNVTML